MAATPMTGGEALVRSLYNEGVRVVFGLPGVQLYGVMAALRDEPRIRFITTRHEQATSFMADGYARAGGTFGTALVVPGPGLLNAMSGLSTAYSASSPVLMLSGQIPRDSIGRDVGLLHEVNDQQDCIAPVTKWRRRVLEVADVPAAVREAVRQLRSGRPRNRAGSRDPMPASGRRLWAGRHRLCRHLPQPVSRLRRSRCRAFSGRRRTVSGAAPPSTRQAG